MKYSYPTHRLTVLFIAVSLMFVSFGTNAQTTSSELVFKNATLDSGKAGKDGAIYRFPSVKSGVDARVKITGRSSSLVKLEDIDLTNTGFDKAFQPQVSYNNGNASRGNDWWMEFQVSFVQTGTKVPATVSSFNATALDIDGDDNGLAEYVNFYKQNSYTLEQHSQLTVASLLDNLLDNLLSLLLPPTPGKKFTGTTTDHSGIDTSATALMVTNTYNNTNTFTVRTGASTSKTTSEASRMYAFYFKSFSYQASTVATLPVTMINWNATYSNNTVSLKWTTTVEKNASHFIVERSADGVEYTDAAMLFAVGNSDVLNNYAYNDKIPAANTGVLYYRIRSVDMDGKSTVSETKVIRLGAATANTVKITTYPNPVQSELRITVPASWQNKSVIYQLINTNGQTVKTIVTGNAGQTEVMSMSQVPSGIYIMKVTCGNETGIQSILK